MHPLTEESSAFSALRLLVGWQEGHLVCKNWVGCWHGYLSGARCRLAYVPADATATHSLFSKIQIGFTFLVPAYLGSPRKGPLKGCVSYWRKQWNFTQMYDISISQGTVVTSFRSGGQDQHITQNFFRIHTHTHTHLTALFPGLLRWAGTRKVEPIWILLKQETVASAGPDANLHLAPDR